MAQSQLKAALFVVILGLASLAHAGRFLVVMKNKEVFSQVHTQYMLGNSTSMASIQLNGSEAQKSAVSESDVQLEGSFEHLQTLVVQADSAEQVEKLKAAGLAVSVEPEIFHPAPRPIAGYSLTQPWDYSLAQPVDANIAASSPSARRLLGAPWGIDAVKAPQAWALSKRGQGARVVILDTGIDKDHPALKNQIEETRDFVNDKNQPYDVADHVGHGSHVAGTIAGAQLSNGFVGVAPAAKILVGRVCSEEGCSNISVAAGINWAISRKADIVSMSLGGPVPTASEKRAVEIADKAGVTVIAATGNDGKPSVSFPAAFSSVIAVGAIDSKMQKAKFSNWGPEVAVVGPGVDVVSSVPVGSGRESKAVVIISGQSTDVNSTSFVGSPEITTPMTNTLVVAGLGKPDDFKTANVSGKFAFIKRGEITFAEKIKNAIAANAAGVILYNNEPGLIQGAVTSDGSTVAIPIVMVESTVGEDAVRKIAAGVAVQMTIATLATDYASFSGTSMATPHVAGVAALVKAANKSLRPTMMKSILQATATPMSPNDENQLGAGLVNAEKAVGAALRAN